MTKRPQSLRINAPFFRDFEMPNGFLARDPACHALWYYCGLIRRQINESNETIRYDNEGPVVPERHAKNLFETVAFLYGVAPEKMLQFWTNVDLQMAQMGADKMPAWSRFDKVQEVRTQ